MEKAHVERGFKQLRASVPFCSFSHARKKETRQNRGGLVTVDEQLPRKKLDNLSDDLWLEIDLTLKMDPF